MHRQRGSPEARAPPPTSSRSSRHAQRRVRFARYGPGAPVQIPGPPTEFRAPVITLSARKADPTAGAPYCDHLAARRVTRASRPSHDPPVTDSRIKVDSSTFIIEGHSALSTAVVTGASRGLGKALSEGLARRGWSLIVDGRDPDLLNQVHDRLWKLIPPGSHVVAIPGDVTDPEHRRALAVAAHALGGLDLLICNAGVLGPSPLPALANFSLAALRELFEVYPVASLGLIQE